MRNEDGNDPVDSPFVGTQGEYGSDARNQSKGLDSCNRKISKLQEANTRFCYQKKSKSSEATNQSKRSGLILNFWEYHSRFQDRRQLKRPVPWDRTNSIAGDSTDY